MAEVNAVFGQPETPFVDLLRTAIAGGQDATRGQFRKHPVSHLMRRFRDEVRCFCVCVCARVGLSTPRVGVG
jgi:hypothetical protein